MSIASAMRLVLVYIACVNVFLARAMCVLLVLLAYCLHNIFIACDTKNIQTVKKIIKQTQNSELNIGYKCHHQQ